MLSRKIFTNLIISSQFQKYYLVLVSLKKMSVMFVIRQLFCYIIRLLDFLFEKIDNFMLGIFKSDIML